MAQNTKVIHELEQKRSGIEKEIQTEKTRLGWKLLEHETLFADFRQRKEDLALAENMKTEAESAVTSLTADISAAKSKLDALDKQQDEACHILGRFLFENYTSQMVGAFGSAYDEANGIDAKIKTAQDEVSRLETEIAVASFLKKVSLQIKKSTLQGTVSAETKKLNQLLDRSARLVVQEQKLPLECGGNPYSDCTHLQEEILSEKAHIDGLTAARASREADKKQAQESISALELSCEDLEHQCNAQALTEAETYVAGYIDGKARNLQPFPEETEVYLKQIQLLMQNVLDTNRVIELKKVEDAIADCNTQIEKMQADYDETQRAIEKLQNHGREVLANMEGSRSLLENYRIQKKALEAAADPEITE